MSVFRFCCEDETGEIVTYYIDKETGEPYFGECTPPLIIPQPRNQRTSSVKKIKLPRGCGYNKKKLQSLRKDIVEGSNIVSYRMLLIPTLLIFPALICVLLMLLETYLHVRCHKKNKLLKDPSKYYRSPFHLITRTFCGVCRELDSATRVGQLQDERRIRYDYVKGMV